MLRPSPAAARRPVPAALAVLTALMTGAACTAPPSAAPSTAPSPTGAPPPAATSSAPPGPSGDLERFYGQTLAWGSCADFATSALTADAFATPGLECSRVQVPLDYAAPGGRTAEVAVLKRPAEDPAVRIGSLVVNPGGPGGSGTATAAALTDRVAGSELGRRFDLVGFDPRGVAASRPALECRTDAEIDAERLDLDVDTSPAGVATTEAEDRAYAQQCADRVGLDVLANVGTRDVARDLDVLRAVLGDEQLTYLGYSYGTQIGTEYAEQFPDRVRALVLDGAVDPGQDFVEKLVNQGAGFQQAFDAFVRWCLDRPRCWLGDAPAEQAPARFQELIRPLLQGPLPVGDRVLSYEDAITGTQQALYSDQFWQFLDQGLRDLGEGRGELLLQLADIYLQRSPQGYSNSEDAFTAIRCVDTPPVDDPERSREAERRFREAAPFLDDGNPASSARDVCAFWPVEPTSAPAPPQVDGLPQVLVVSTTGDPATPYQAGVELAGQLGGRLLTYEGDQHTVALEGVACVDDAVTGYLVELRLPPDGTRCRS